jgi:DNA-binding transcriptional LysR family regulator
MVDWNDLRYFLAVHRAGTLAGAAAKLGINATTVGRRISALEEDIAARLFDRTPDGWRLTPPGRDLLPHAERMEEEAFAVERDLRGADQRVSGTVRLATTEMLGTRFLAPHLPRFAERCPGITLEIACSPQSVSLARGDADVVLRLSRPREDDVVARELTSIHLSLYAARSYWERRGPVVDSLAGQRVIRFAATSAFALENAWMEPRVAGAEVVLRSDSVSAIFAAALAGLGVALLPRVVADAEPELIRIPTDPPPEPRRIWQGVHRDLVKTARVQRVTAFLAEVVADGP